MIKVFIPVDKEANDPFILRVEHSNNPGVYNLIPVSKNSAEILAGELMEALNQIKKPEENYALAVGGKMGRIIKDARYKIGREFKLNEHTLVIKEIMIKSGKMGIFYELECNCCSYPVKLECGEDFLKDMNNSEKVDNDKI